jgi:hypothetical protein
MGGALAALALGTALNLAPGGAAAAALKIKPLAAGLGFEYFSRTVVWSGDTVSSKIGAGLITARADLGLGRGATVSLTAGLSLTDFKALSFASLPISLRLGSPTLKGFALGAETVVPIRKLSDFEISGTGRIVYSFGMSKTWALEDFAVAGKAVGESSWLEAAAGPRLSYVVSAWIVPYVEVWARWLHADFDMTETLGDLAGRQSRSVHGDLEFSVALGADANVTDRIAVKAKAGFLPYAGGVDGVGTIAILYRF